MNKPDTETAPQEDILLSRAVYEDKELDAFNVEAMQGMAEDEIEHVITLLCLREKQLQYDKKTLTSWFKELLDGTAEKREAVLDHLKTRKEADKQALRMIAMGLSGPPDRTTNDAGDRARQQDRA